MGGFLFIKKDKRSSLIENEIKNYSPALEVFKKKKLTQNICFDKSEFILFVFQKRFSDILNYCEFKNGDFIAITGTFIYNGKTGIEGLQKIYSDYKLNHENIKNIRGNYCVLLYLNGEFFIFRDFFGYYPVYTNSDYSFISSSYLAVCMLMEKLSVSKQEFFEYLLNGYFYSEKTIFKEINLLDEGMIIKIIPDIQKKKWNIKASDYESRDDFERAAEDISIDLLGYFKEISYAFPNRIRTAISGGYDTRLMLACLLKLGMKPDLYVNGTPNSPDILCAKEICAGENLPLEIIHFYKWFDELKNDYNTKVNERFYFFDGLGAGGIFDNYSDYEFKINNSKIDDIVLNGAGGEIYRESWNLPNRKFSVNGYLQARYNKLDFSFCMPTFKKKKYFNILKEKIYLQLKNRKKTIERQEIEYLHPLRYKAAHFIFTIMQQLNHFIMPFLEPELLFKSFEIPIRWKLDGKFYFSLMKNIYPEIAKYNSIYGYNFIYPIPLKNRLKNSLNRNIPLHLRPFLRKFRKSRKLPVQQYGFDLLSEEYIASIYDFDKMLINDYVDIKLIKDQTILSRALSLEKLIKEYST